MAPKLEYIELNKELKRNDALVPKFCSVFNQTGLENKEKFYRLVQEISVMKRWLTCIDVLTDVLISTTASVCIILLVP